MAPPRKTRNSSSQQEVHVSGFGVVFQVSCYLIMLNNATRFIALDNHELAWYTFKTLQNITTATSVIQLSHKYLQANQLPAFGKQEFTFQPREIEFFRSREVFQLTDLEKKQCQNQLKLDMRRGVETNFLPSTTVVEEY